MEPQQISNWEWLISGPNPDILRVWKDKFWKTLNKPIEGIFEPITWDVSYSRWNSSSDAQKWISDANKLLREVRDAVNRLSPLIPLIEAAHGKYKTQRQIIISAGIPENVALDHIVVTSWMTLFAEHATAATSRWDSLPWSSYNNRIRQLKQFEKQLRPIFPISIWQRIGTLNNEGRSALGEVLEKCQEWSNAQVQWREMEISYHDVENTYFLLRTKANSLGFTSPPKSTESEE